MKDTPLLMYSHNKHGFRQYWVFLFIWLLAGVCQAENTVLAKMAFYYGNKPPSNQLKLYDNVVVEPDSGIDPHQFDGVNTKILAYVSLGEINNLRQFGKSVNQDWILGKNEVWKSMVMDQSNPAWQAFFLENAITPLWNKGYRGFFLDTLDSYRLAVKTPEQMKKQQDGIVAIITAIKKKYPEARIITNRGFELLPQIKSEVEGVVAESLFKGWNNQKKQYVNVGEAERKQLLKELDIVKKMGLPVTVIDYLSPKEAADAKQIAKKIADLGFNPWITNGALTELYLFNVDILPRKILLFYQGKPGDVDEKLGSYMSRAVAMPLNYLGYTTILRNLADPLPDDLTAKEYAGIVLGIDTAQPGKEQALYNWYLAQIRKKIPLVILNNLGFEPTPEKLKALGLSSPLFTYAPQSIKIVYQAPMIGFEIPPVIKMDRIQPISLRQGHSLLKVKNNTGGLSDVAAITPWGGYFLTESFLVPVIGNNYRWSINPFDFFKQALQLEDRPIPDTTTENGRRLMFVHIDGDGFANRGEWHNGPFTAEIVRKDFLEHYAIPSTVSIIQGEIAANGIYPKLSPQLEKIARQIFALPHVEIASHTFSHPFNWRDAAAYKGNKPNPFTLRIPNYRFNLETEVTGSVDYINKKLAPKDKKCKVFLWSGDGDASAKALELTYQLGIDNMNPGTKYNNSVSGVSALGLFEEPYFQVFAPIGNDNEIIAHSVTFYTLIDVIDALKATDKPRRLKPIDIYYHFFTVSQMGGVKALHAVYKWSLEQNIMNIYASEYSKKVLDFNQLVIAKKGDGWLVETSDALRELRIPRSMGYPDVAGSINIIGYNLINDDYYVHLGSGGEAFIRITKQPPSIPYLVDANVKITRFIRKKDGIDFSVEGYLPPLFTFENVQNCTLLEENKIVAHQSQQKGQKSYAFKKGGAHDFSIQCK